MTELVATRPAPIARLRDLVELGKPRLSVLVIFTSAVGVWLAPVQPGPVRTVAFLLATACLVAAANAINSWIERDIDALMLRTRNRPLPAGRLEPTTALTYGILVSAVSLLCLYLLTNPLTTLLGAIALVCYVLVYTPLKRVTPWAVVVGAVPGAIPPLMGWTAATGSLDPPGWFLCGVLFFWQLPHFIAISLYLQEDYRRGGIRALPLVSGDFAARGYLLVATLFLVAHTMTALWLGLAGTVYAVTAVVLGLVFVGWAAIGLWRTDSAAWARRIFAYTLIYLPLLIAVLVLDRS